MGTTEGHSGPQQVPGWVMSANEVIERLSLLIRINVAWMALTLLGLIVLGLAPATAAAADAIIASRKGGKVRVLPAMWTSYRANLVRANARMLPLQMVQAGAFAMLLLAFSGALVSSPMMVAVVLLATVSMAWATASLAAVLAAPRLRRQDLLVSYRIALLVPGALPLRSIVLTVVLAFWALVSVLVVPIAILVGAAAALDLAVGLFGRRTEGLLEQIDQAHSAQA